MKRLCILAVFILACSRSHDDPNDDRPADWVDFCETITTSYCASGVDDRPPEQCEEEDRVECAEDLGWPCLPIPTRAQARECVGILTDYWTSTETADFPAECDYWACLFEE